MTGSAFMGIPVPFPLIQINDRRHGLL